jgi:hypothetical protein
MCKGGKVGGFSLTIPNPPLVIDSQYSSYNVGGIAAIEISSTGKRISRQHLLHVGFLLEYVISRKSW